MKFYPYKKAGGGGGRKSFSHAEGGAQTGFGVVFTRSLEVLAILYGGAKSFHSLKGGGGHKKYYPVLRGGGGAPTNLGPAVFPFCSPPFPVINDQSFSLIENYHIPDCHLNSSTSFIPIPSLHFIVHLGLSMDLSIDSRTTSFQQQLYTVISHRRHVEIKM